MTPKRHIQQVESSGSCCTPWHSGQTIQVEAACQAAQVCWAQLLSPQQMQTPAKFHRGGLTGVGDG